MKKTIEIRKCVCGKEETFEIGNIGGGHFSNWSFYERKREIMSRDEFECDLCPDCAKKVESFIYTIVHPELKDINKIGKYKIAFKKIGKLKREDGIYQGFWSKDEYDIVSDPKKATIFDSLSDAVQMSGKIENGWNTTCYQMPPIIIEVE